jgi:hypothetical protein
VAKFFDPYQKNFPFLYCEKNGIVKKYLQRREASLATDYANPKQEIKMLYYQIFHSEYKWGSHSLWNEREEGPADGFASREEAEKYCADMRADAIKNGQQEYADALNVQPVAG